MHVSSPRPAARAGLALAVFVLVSPTVRAADPVRWRTDYNAARAEAEAAGLPLCLQIGTDDCFYCRKMEATTLRDPGVTGLLGGQFVPIKLDAGREAALAKALRVQVYPTTVLAGPDGTIHAVVQGYVAADQFRDHLKRTAVAAADDLKLARDLRDAAAAAKSGDYATALAAAQRAALVGKGRAAERLAAATDAAAVAGVVRVFPGTRAASRAEAQLAAAGKGGDLVPPRAVLTAAERLAEKGEYANALDLLAYLARGPADAPETRAAAELAERLRANPAALAAAARQAAEKAAALQVELSASFAAAGKPADAAACLELALRLSPSGPKADHLRAQLAKLRGGTPATPATLSR